MTFREVGKALRDIWLFLAVILFVIADANRVFDGSWIGLAADVISFLLFAWLILFAIGVSRGEPNP